jgi:tetratricopeptide (TPR) repeat protein
MQNDLKTPQDCLKYGLELNEAGRAEEALEVFSRGLAMEPYHPELRLQRGRKNIAARRWQAASDLELAVKIDPSNWETWYYLGVTYYLLKNYKKSRECFNASLENSSEALIPAVDWLWNLENKLGEEKGVLNLITNCEALPDDPDYAYARRIMLYKGAADPENFFDWEVLEKRGSDDIDYVTQAYGLANWRAFRGEMEKSNEILKSIAEKKGAQKAFAYMLALQDIEDRNLTI